MAEDQRAEYLLLATFARLDEAEVARGLLEAEAIPAALLDAQVAGPGLGPFVGGVRLLVPAWSLERARELLATPADDALPTPTPAPWDLSPTTGATARGARASGAVVWVAVLLTTGLFLALARC